MAFSIKESVGFGWQAFKQHSGILLFAVILMTAIEIVSGISSAALEHNPVADFVISVLLGIFSFVIGAGYVAITLKLAKGESAHYRDIVPPFIILWRYFASAIALGAMMFGVVLAGLLISFLATPIFSGMPDAAAAAGVLVIIVGGLVIGYLGLRYSMVTFAVLEGEKVVESFKKSTKLTEGVKWKLVGFLLTMVGIVILGIICLVVGLLVAIPVTDVAYAHVYQKLKSHAGKKP